MAHAGKFVCLGNVLMATRTEGWIYITGASLICGRGTSWPGLRNNAPCRGEYCDADQQRAPFPGVQRIPSVIEESLPAAYSAYVHMNKIGLRVIAHAPAAQGQRRIANLCARNSGNANIDGLRFHVLAVLGNAMSMLA
jgi:hypothetical protein